MTRRLTAIHPFLFAAVYVLHVAAGNSGYFEFGDLLLVLASILASTLAGFGLLYLVARLTVGSAADPRVPALLTLLPILWFFGLPQAMRISRGGPANPKNVAITLLVLLGSGLVVGWLARRPRLLQTGSTLLTLAGTLLVLRFVADIAADRMRARAMVAESALARDLARPIQDARAAPSPRRDVYLLVLDEYANAAVLRERFGYDNSPFEDSLKALGFHIPAQVRSNYFHTILSLPSLLNAAHVHRVGQELPRGVGDPTLANRLLERSRVASYLKARKYRYIFFPSLWWESTQHTPLADSTVRVGHTSSLSGWLSRTGFRRGLQKVTVLRWLNPEATADAEHVRRTLDAFEQLPSVKGPVFAFAHVVSPHWPYVLDKNCEPPTRLVKVDRIEGYIGQLQCLNSMVLHVVTRLLRDSKVAPVILLQGDHGTTTLRYSKAPSAEQVPDAAARERFGAFGAYYLPDSGEVAFGDTVTVVNVLGNVLRYYFGADLAREPEHRYLSLERSPFEFRRDVEPLPSSSLLRSPRAPRPEDSGDTSAVAPPRRLRRSS